MRQLLVAERVVTLLGSGGKGNAPGLGVLVEGDRVVWVGDPVDAPVHERRIELPGALLQPAFVDAHVHLTDTGLSLTGLDLHECDSLRACLEAVSTAARGPGQVVWGGGWDESSWPEARPPTAAELTEVGHGRPVRLSRADGHSCAVDRRALERMPLSSVDGVEYDAAGQPTGLLRREANHLARRWFLAQLPDPQLSEARDAVVAHALQQGVASVHEMGGPDLMGASDFDAWVFGEWPLEVVGYWGALDLGFLDRRGLRRIGEVFLDGSLGSRTAAVRGGYRDGSRGRLYLPTEDLAAFTAEATRRGVQLAYHCIGDEAVRQAVEVFLATADELGMDRVRAHRHRLEHCELVPHELIPVIAQLGLVVSVQPAFDALWGGRGRMYAERLGADRAWELNPFRPLVDASVPLAIGSDTDVTPLDPWGGVAAAAQHHRHEFALDPDVALHCAIVGGRYAAHQDDVGRIASGERADLAAFAIQDGVPRDCVLTLVRGSVVHHV